MWYAKISLKVPSIQSNFIFFPQMLLQTYKFNYIENQTFPSSSFKRCVCLTIFDYQIKQTYWKIEFRSDVLPLYSTIIRFIILVVLDTKNMSESAIFSKTNLLKIIDDIETDIGYWSSHRNRVQELVKHSCNVFTCII